MSLFQGPIACWNLPQQDHRHLLNLITSDNAGEVPFKIPVLMQMEIPGGGGALGYFLGGYVLPGPPNWHPILKKNFPKTDSPF